MINKRQNYIQFIGVTILGMASLSFPSYSADEKLPSVMSLDYCADQYILTLADREQIVALSSLAEDPISFHREKAKGIQTTRSSIAEVITLKPDVAIQTYAGAAHMEEMTSRVGISLVRTTYGRDIETMYQNLRHVGESIGKLREAENMIKDFKKRLAKIQNAEKSNLKVAYITPSGFTAGTGTFVDDIIKLSGFDTYAEANGYKSWLSIPIEDLIINPPDLIVTSFFDTNIRNQSNWSLSRHDHLMAMMEEIPTVHLSGSMMACDGLFLVDIAEDIRSQATALGVLSSND